MALAPIAQAADLRSRGDPRGRLHTALGRAAGRAWRTLDIALAGNSFLDRFGRPEDGPLHDQLRAFLASLPGEIPGRDGAARELRAAREAGVLAVGPPGDDPAANRSADPTEALAAELDRAGYGQLARAVTHRPAGRLPLVVAAVRYFFRREVEGDAELARSLPAYRADGVTADQEAGFAALFDAMAGHADRLAEVLGDDDGEEQPVGLDVKAELAKSSRPVREIGGQVMRVLEKYKLDERAVGPDDGHSIAADAEQSLVLGLAARYRALPEGERNESPALLNAMGKLQLAAGDFDAAQRDFASAAQLASSPEARAEARHNAYRAALERGRHDEALRELLHAVKLDPRRFAPFPVGKYLPQRILGAGGFGVAFLCKHRDDGGLVVVKALHPERLERGAASLVREAQMLAALRHPAVLRPHHCDFADQAKTRAFLVMDYFEGVTLRQYVADHGRIPPALFAPLARQLADGLRTAHSQGILHRDVKPANILVRREAGEWDARLIDFGLALRRSAFTDTLAVSRVASGAAAAIAGTRDYAAPEQFGRLPGVPVGRAADVYGFAKTCCFALFGTPQPLLKHWREVPEHLAALLGRCLADDPKDRPHDFADVIAALDGSDGPRPEPVPAPVVAPEPPEPPEPPVRPGPPVQYVAPEPVALPPRPRPRPKRRPKSQMSAAYWIGGGLGAALVVLLVVILVGAGRRNTRPTTTEVAAAPTNRKATEPKDARPTPVPKETTEPADPPMKSAPMPMPMPPAPMAVKWGTPIDPDGDCTITTDQGTLTIRIPGVAHDMSIEDGRINAPHVMQEIDGDFTVRVKVCGQLRPGNGQTTNNHIPVHSGGLMVWADSRNYLRLDRAGMTRNGQQQSASFIELRAGGQKVGAKWSSAGEDDTYQKLVRRGNTITGSISTNGKDWTVLEKFTTKFPPKVSIGVFAVNVAREPLTIRFEEFQIEP
jgi:serine/threonine protein kinase